MTVAEELYNKIADELPNVTRSKMFGAQCLKAPNGKAGIMLHKGNFVVKLEGATQAEALALPGAHMFTPMEGRPMNGWVQIPAEHAAKFSKYAAIAMENVAQIEVKPAKKTAKK